MTDWGKYEAAIERWAEIMGEPAPAPTDDEGRLSPELVRWMMGYPKGWVDGITRTGQLRALGNAIVPRQAAAAWALCTGADVSTEAGGGSASADSPNLRQQRPRPTWDGGSGLEDGGGMSLIPTPTAWLGSRPSRSIGDPARWLNPDRSNELSDFVAWMETT